MSTGVPMKAARQAEKDYKLKPDEDLSGPGGKDYFVLTGKIFTRKS